jgi:hypothetical protein
LTLFEAVIDRQDGGNKEIQCRVLGNNVG